LTAKNSNIYINADKGDRHLLWFNLTTRLTLTPAPLVHGQADKQCHLIITTTPCRVHRPQAIVRKAMRRQEVRSSTQTLRKFSNAVVTGVARNPWQRVNAALTLREGKNSAPRCHGFCTRVVA